MVVPANAPGVHELRTADGQVFAVVVSPDEFARLRAEVQALREQVATLQRQKNYYANELIDLLRTWMPVPPTEDDLRAAVPNPEELRNLVAEIEAM
ncbi:MAG: hypothetical protein K2V38_03840 [Gemmataceae bacterium]|nr:hypothetical protein [Gemmataceae bacterium]